MYDWLVPLTEWYTWVSSLVHYLLHHVTAYACRNKFGPLFLFELDQTCVFEEFEYGTNLRIRKELIMWSKISKRKKVDQTCFGMHMPSRDGGDSGSNLRPPCIASLPNISFTFWNKIIFEKYVRQVKRQGHDIQVYQILWFNRIASSRNTML